MKIIYHSLIIVVAIILISPLTTQAVVLIPDDTEAYDLEIAGPEECRQLDGTWDECPSNKCQQTPEYKRGEVVCADVCGDPVCRGIVPNEDDDLSQAHNPYIDQEIKDSPDAPDDTSPIATNNNSSISKKQLTVLVVIGLVLALIFILLKLKKDGNESI